MKSVIRSIIFGIIAFSSAAHAMDDNALTEILRTAALKNGLRPAAQLFDSRDTALADAGKLFFESKNVSLNAQISCKTCHLDQFGSADGVPNGIGIFGQGEGPARALSGGRIIPRNTLPFWGRGGRGFETFFWDGKVDFAEGKKTSQFGIIVPSDDPLVTAVHLPPVEIREMIDDDADVSRYKREATSAAGELYERIMQHLARSERTAVSFLGAGLNKKDGDVTFHDVARSIAAFIRSKFRLKETKFHEFVFGNGRLKPEELRGGLIFYGKGKCVNCHNGPYFSDLKFHAVPLPQIGFGKNGFGVDYGRFNVTFRSDDLYKFRTPPLFNVEKTAPYGHAGSIANLRDAIVAHFDPLRVIDPTAMDGLERHEFFKRMAATGATFNMLSILSDGEVADVESFLKTLRFE